MKKKLIRHLTKDVSASIQLDAEILKHTAVYVVSSSVKRYENNLFLLAKLSKGDRLLLDFLTECMNTDNIVENKPDIRKDFNDILKKIGVKEYSDSTIHKSFSRLCELELIIKLENRGYYQINPLFFFKGTDEQREKAIRKNLEKINAQPILKYRKELLSNKKID